MAKPTSIVLSVRKEDIKNTLTTQEWWGSLKPEDQTATIEAVTELGSATLRAGVSRLAMGEQLVKLHTLLQPKRVFVKTLDLYNISRKTAYRLMSGWTNAQKRLPPAVLQQAMLLNMPILGESEDKPFGAYTDSIKKLPPPKTEDPARVRQYLKTIDHDRRKRMSRAERHESGLDTDQFLKLAYRSFNKVFQKLPHDSKVRASWVRSLVGMMMSDLGIGNNTSFGPVAVPTEFRPVVGRPKKKKSTDEEEKAA